MKNEQQNCMQTRKTNKVIINLAKKLKKVQVIFFILKTHVMISTTVGVAIRNRLNPQLKSSRRLVLRRLSIK